jgi:hypothetical protein
MLTEIFEPHHKMKNYFTSLLILFFMSSTFGQTKIDGEYKLYTNGDSTDISQGVILKFNCNNTFIQHDTIATGYGTWSIKNNSRLILQFDSIAENNRMNIVKTKIVYIIEDGSIYRKTIPKKEYTNYKNSVKNYFKSINSSFQFANFESFSVYKAKQLKRYYQKLKAYSCD